MLRRENLVLSLIVVFLLNIPCLSWAWSGKVVGVADGDTITVLRDKEQVRVSLYGIDTPEQSQAFSKKAKQFTSGIVFGEQVRVESITEDRYGRTVGIVFLDGLILNEELIAVGLAWVYTRYCDRPICQKWKRLEFEAREAKMGLWADPNPIPPWMFRRKRRE